ncbi:hypothetical protein Hanom_Chr02g00136521 [Helianthus anomalus]
MDQTASNLAEPMWVSCKNQRKIERGARNPEMEMKNEQKTNKKNRGLQSVKEGTKVIKALCCICNL